MPEMSYVICGTPRTGSTLLCALLRATGIAGWPESYFRRQGEGTFAGRWGLPVGYSFADFVRAAVAAGTTANGVFGVRIMWGTLDEVVRRLGPEGSDLELLTEALGPMRFLHLRRQDTVAQAVSWARAEQTGFWHPGENPGPGSETEPRFDAEQIGHLMRTIETHNAHWHRWFAGAGIRPYPVTYEDLVADPAGVLRGVLDLLELELPPDRIADAVRTARGEQRRQADALSAEWVAEYRRRVSP